MSCTLSSVTFRVISSASLSSSPCSVLYSADYFAARRELEATYLKSLQKIAKRSFLSDPTALGANFLPVYERLIGEIGEVARIHGELEKKLEIECEMPMRNASAKGDWSRIKENDDNLSSTLKEIATLESQLAKDQKKVEGASSKKASQAQQKVAETERALRQTTELWEAEAPFAFEAYQRIDLQRLELMKEVVAKFETAQSDAAQRTMQMTEQTMQITLNFDPQTDMQEFVLKNATATGALGRPTQSSANRSTSAGTRSGAAQQTPINASMNTSQPTPQHTNGLNEFGRPVRQSSASIHSTERSSGQAQDQSTPSKTLGGSTLKSALTRFGRGRSNRNANDTAQSTYGTLSEGPISMPPPSASKGREGVDGRRSIDSRSDIGGSSAVPSSLMAPLAPTSVRPSSNFTPTSPSAPPQVDAEGYTIPPPNRDRKPWELDNVHVPSSNLMDDEATESMDPAILPKMTGMSIAQKPIMEDEATDQAALERMRSTLLTSRSPAMAPPQRRNTTRRDRRDVRNTTYNPVMDDGNRPMSTFGLPLVNTPPTQASPSGFVASPGIGPERTQSMISSSSASNIGNTTLDSISASAPIAHGLNAQITERVNVVLNGRNVSKIMVVGEISITVRDLTAAAPVHMRIDAFEQLEKAAPNPQFMKEMSGKPGEYTLDVPALVRHSGAAVTGSGRATVLKYQLHVPAHRANEYVPLYIAPQWRCEDKQTSILLNFSSNADSRITAGAASMPGASLQDVTLSVDVSSAGLTNIMSKPTAVYVAEQKKLFWRLNEPLPVVTAEDASAHKALARFQVDTKSEPRPVEVRWKLPGLSVSSLDLSLIDGGDVAFGTIARQVVSGKYMANP